MTAFPASWADLPIEQRRIRAECAHPAGSFVESRPEGIARSVSECFEEPGGIPDTWRSRPGAGP